MKSYVVEAFSEYFEGTQDKRMTGFVERQLKAKSARTRKKAKEFLKR